MWLHWLMCYFNCSIKSSLVAVLKAFHLKTHFCYQKETWLGVVSLRVMLSWTLSLEMRTCSVASSPKPWRTKGALCIRNRPQNAEDDNCKNQNNGHEFPDEAAVTFRLGWCVVCNFKVFIFPGRCWRGNFNAGVPLINCQLDACTRGRPGRHWHDRALCAYQGGLFGVAFGRNCVLAEAVAGVETDHVDNQAIVDDHICAKTLHGTCVCV